MKRYISYSVIAVLITVLLLQCEKNTDYRNIAKQNEEALTDSIKHYKNKLGTITASRQTLQLTQQQLQQELIEKDAELAALAAEFKTIKNLTRFKSNIQLEPVNFAFDEPLYPASAEDTTDYFERKGFTQTQWYSMGYKVTNDSLTIQPFTTWTETTVITGFKRKWFLGRQTLVTDVTNTNPYINVTAIQAADVTVPEPWYKKWYMWLAAGFVTGIAVTAN
ncbi:hypothetical protein E0W68_09465 [Flavobacterium salilacus subsp. salilacus]|uniref:DUF6549 family protein n=1 Tax=Flavobacterium TaxID=237 RepID=UPI001074F08A|nr:MULTISPECIES: DUF6549 family protein [Flavobacterium]KAF2518242.1 hypothetical protein E0W68_09465 [Flavobacterium salilacus subsp. salilacus]MBE1615348.1 hypothetical protein [Flavobacterium sp. SaA2.13]